MNYCTAAEPLRHIGVEDQERRSLLRYMLLSVGLHDSGDGEAPAGGGEWVASRVAAPGGWLSVMAGVFGRLLQLINDVLDISKIQAGKLSLYIEEDVNLNDEINVVVEMAEPLLQKQNASLEQPIRFIQDVDQNLPLTACDRRRIRQVLLNLLSNAIKFTEQGSITLSAKKKGDEFIFAVMDTGPGIPQEMQARIFEPFIQVTGDIKHTQGTGLGLPISRSLVQAHGGALWVESGIGEGTTFFFTLPFRPEIAQ